MLDVFDDLCLLKVDAQCVQTTLLQASEHPRKRPQNTRNTVEVPAILRITGEIRIAEHRIGAAGGQG